MPRKNRNKIEEEKEEILGKFETIPKKRVYREKTEEEKSGNPSEDMEAYKIYKELWDKEQLLKKDGKTLDKNDASAKQYMFDEHHRMINRGGVYTKAFKTAKKYYNNEGEHVATDLWTKKPRDYIKSKKHHEYTVTKTMDVDRATSDIGEGVVRVYKTDDGGRRRHVATRLKTTPVAHPGVPINMQFRKQKMTKSVKKPVTKKPIAKKPMVRKLKSPKLVLWKPSVKKMAIGKTSTKKRVTGKRKI